MLRLGISIRSIKAIFVSHEHTDHIKGIAVISRKYQTPVYLNQTMIYNGCVNVQKDLIRKYDANQPVRIGALEITSFPKLHDACDPHSFIVRAGTITIGVMTDIGRACEQVIKYFNMCDAVFLEANYDDEMLSKGKYPYYLKNRIRSGKGHLSNREALELFLNHRAPSLSHLLLSHLSKDNNCPDLVQNLFNEHAGKTQVIVASRYNESQIFRIGKEPGEPAATSPLAAVEDAQYSLF
jgi:phosphoribosyl 1,2-cyclic phosphodiesterase